MKLQEFKIHLKLGGLSMTHFHYMSRFFNVYKEFTKENTTKYMLNMMDSGKYKKETINCNTKAMNAYAKFIGSDIRQQYIKVDKTVPKNITKEFFEMEMLPMVKLAWPDTYIKNEAILYYMFLTGSRIGDVTKQRRVNIDFIKNEILIINQKSKHERIIPMVPELSNKLKLYFRIENEGKNCFNTTIASIRGIFNMLKINFPEKYIKPHLMRAGFATYFYDAGMDLYDIQYLLGHSNAETTMRYVERKFKRIKEKMLKMKRKDLNNVIDVQAEKIDRLEKMIDELKKEV